MHEPHACEPITVKSEQSKESQPTKQDPGVKGAQARPERQNHTLSLAAAEVP